MSSFAFGWDQEIQAPCDLSKAFHRTVFITVILLGIISSASASTAGNWQLISTPASATQINGFAIDQNNYWYIADRNTGFWISKDQGTSWMQVNSGLPTTCGQHIQFDPHNNSVIASLYTGTCSTYSGGTTNWYRSASQGSTWTQISKPAGFSASFDAQTAGLMPPATGGTMLLGGQGSGTACMYSTDDGATTALCSGGLASIRGFGRAASSILGIGGENGGYQVSINGGANFTTVWAPPSALGEIVSMVPSCAGPTLLAGLTGVWQATGTSSSYSYTQVFTLSQRSRVLYQDSSCNLYLGQRQLNQNPTVLKCSYTVGNMQCSEWDTGIGTGLEAHEFVENTSTGTLCAVIENGSTNAGWLYCTGSGSSGGGTSGGSSSSSGGSTSSGGGSTSGGSTSSSGGSSSSSGGQTSGSSTGGSSYGGTLAMQVSLPLAHIGAQYYGTASGIGGVTPYRYSLSASSLPPGLVMDGSTGVISGTPTTIGTYNFKLVTTDSTGSQQYVQGQISVLYPSDKKGGGSGVTVSVSPSSGGLASGQTQQFLANVSGTTNTAVTWSASAGSISTSGLFTAPRVSSNTSVTVTASSVAYPKQKASAVMTVSAPAAISVAVTPSTATVGSGSTQQFGASVLGTSNTAVTWSASAGNISSGGMYTAPTVSTTMVVSVTATSVADTTKTSSATVSVTPASTAALAVSTSSLPGAWSGTAYSYPLQAAGGTTPYQWAVASGSLPQGFTLSATGQLAGTTAQTGQFSFMARVTDASNNSSSKALTLTVAQQITGGGNYDGPAQLPQIFLQTALANTPAPGSKTVVSAGGSLQNALNAANCGDTIELAAGATFTGNVTFPAKPCDDQHWIIVRTSAPDAALPPEGTRMLPCYAGVSSLPGRPAFSCPAGVTNVLARIVDPVPSTGNSGPITFAAGANHYRLLGLEITRTPGGPDYRLIGGQSTVDHIIVDRSWLHGSPIDDNTSAWSMNGMSYAALIDSYANDFHCTSVVGVCTDGKVVGGGTSTTQDGPFKITNNFLEASGESVLFGGGAATLTPADIEIRSNHFYKPLIWMQGQPGYVGGISGYPFVVKNHLELKNAQRVLVEGNIFEYSWGGFSQVGFSILLTPKNQAINGMNICPLCAVMDVTIRYNKFSHTGTGISMANSLSDAGGAALAGERYSLHDLTFDDISASKYNGPGGLFQIANSFAVNPLNNISINHVTAFPDPISHFYSVGNAASLPPMYAFGMTNSIIGQTRYPVWSTGGTTNCAISDVPLSVLNACFPLGYTFQSNAIIGGTSGNYALSTWPLNNYFPIDATSVQFVNFSGGNGGDYHLAASSPYKNAATDGKDLGADIDAILAATANAY